MPSGEKANRSTLFAVAKLAQRQDGGLCDLSCEQRKNVRRRSGRVNGPRHDGRTQAPWSLQRNGKNTLSHPVWTSGTLEEEGNDANTKSLPWKVEDSCTAGGVQTEVRTHEGGRRIDQEFERSGERYKTVNLECNDNGSSLGSCKGYIAKFE